MSNMLKVVFYLFTALNAFAQELTFNQDHPVWDRGRQWLVANGQVYVRPERQGRFSRGTQPGLRTPTFLEQPGFSFDGEFAYRGVNQGRDRLALGLGYEVESNAGSRWFWKRPVVLSGPVRFLAGTMQRALLFRHSGTENRKVSIELYDFVEERLTTLLTLENQKPAIDACAVASNWDFYLLLTNGSLFQVPFGETSIKELERDVLQKTVDGMIDRETNDLGAGVVPVPPHFTGNPFFGQTGEIFFPLQVRQRNHWDESAIKRLWDTIPLEAQNRYIASGKWPIHGGYDGSDEIFVLMGYDPATRKCRRAPNEALDGVVHQDEYTAQWKLKAGGWISLAENGEGRILPLKRVLEMPPG